MVPEYKSYGQKADRIKFDRQQLRDSWVKGTKFQL